MCFVRIATSEERKSHAHKTGSWYPLGFFFRISKEHPCLFYMGVPQGLMLLTMTALHVHMEHNIKELAMGLICHWVQTSSVVFILVLKYPTLESNFLVMKLMLTFVSYRKKFLSLPLGKPLLFVEIKNHLAATSAEGSWDSPHGRANLPWTFLALGYCLFPSANTVSLW